MPRAPLHPLRITLLRSVTVSLALLAAPLASAQAPAPGPSPQMAAAQAGFEALPEAERKAMIERWKAMTPEQRDAWVEAHPPKEPRSR